MFKVLPKKVWIPIIIFVVFFLAAIILAAIICFTNDMFVYRLMTKTISEKTFLLKEIKGSLLCKINGGKWTFSYPSYGCAEAFRDGGKPCIKGRDCSTNVCLILFEGNDDYYKRDERKTTPYKGTCPEDSFEISCIVMDHIHEDGNISYGDCIPL